MVLLSFATFALLSIAVVGAAPSTMHVTHERRIVHSHRQWEKRSRLEPHDVIPVRIGLTQCNLDQGHDLLMDVSDPNSKNYGKHWTAEQIMEKFSPTHESIEAIRDWLTRSGISENRIIHSIVYEWIHFNATVQEAEELFQTEYHSFEHALELRSTVGCDEYKVPAHLAQHIDFVHPGVALVGSMARKLMRRRVQPEEQLATREGLDERAAADPCHDVNLLTPNCIRHIYGVPKGDKKAPGNSLGLFESGSWYSPTALETFLANFTDLPPETRPFNTTTDISETHFDQLNYGGEADLDLQLALPLVYPQNVMIYQVDYLGGTLIP